MRFKRPIFLPLSSLLLIFSFQNCGSSSSFNTSNLNINSSLSGNGGGYEGKLSGVYYHYIPSYTCEGNPSADQITEVKEGQAFLYENKTSQCSTQSVPIAVSDMNLSPFQNEFISVKDVLFKRYDIKPVGIPSILAEVLCRDDFEKPSYEIVSHYDRDTNQALARIYFADNIVNDFQIGRILSSDNVTYVSDQIKFSVDFSKPVGISRKFTGRIDASRVHGVSSGSLVCVVGGTLDTSKWNLRELTSRDAGSFYLLGSGEIMFFSEISRNYFSSQFYTSVTHLFKIALDNSVIDFSKTILGDDYSVLYHFPEVDKNKTLFAAKTSSEMWSSLFVYDFKTLAVKKLTNLVAGAAPEAYQIRAPVLTADGHLFYDTEILNFLQGPNSFVLRVFDRIRDTIADVSVINPAAGYIVLPKTNRVAIQLPSNNSTTNVVKIYNAKTKISNDYSLGDSTNCKFNLLDATAYDDESALIITELCADSNRPQVVILDLTNGTKKIIAENKKVEWISTDKKWLILAGADLMRFAYNIQSGVSVSIPIIPNLTSSFGSGSSQGDINNFSQSGYGRTVALINETHLYGFGGNSDAPTLFHVNLTSAVSSSICTDTLGKKMFLGSLGTDKVFLFTYDAVVNVYRFYQIKNSLDCTRINEFPSDYPVVPKLIQTNIGFGLLLGYPLSASSTVYTREAVFVPIDGRPPLKFNSNESSNWEMEVCEDKNRIVLRGPGSDGVLKIFSFNLLGAR